MIFNQKKNGWNLNFEFKENELVYSLVTSTEKSKTKISYLEITGDSWEHIRRNEWYRNVGLLWLVIGIYMNVVMYLDIKSLAPSIWLILGVVMLVIYKVREINFLVLGAGSNNILIIKDSSCEEIYNLLLEKRKDSVLKTYGSINFDNPLDVEVGQFKILLDQEFIDKKKYEEVVKELNDYHKNIPVLSPITSFK